MIEENQRFYEIILTSNQNDIHHKSKYEAVSLAGKQIWSSKKLEQTNTPKRYLNKTLAHYQRIQNGKTANVQHIIEAYQAVKIGKFSCSS